jgi:hypothetical protein
MATVNLKQNSEIKSETSTSTPSLLSSNCIDREEEQQSSNRLPSVFILPPQIDTYYKYSQEALDVLETSEFVPLEASLATLGEEYNIPEITEKLSKITSAEIINKARRLAFEASPQTRSENVINELFASEKDRETTVQQFLTEQKANLLTENTSLVQSIADKIFSDNNIEGSVKIVVTDTEQPLANVGANGVIFISNKLLDLCKDSDGTINPSKIAGVICHEISHVLLDHKDFFDNLYNDVIAQKDRIVEGWSDKNDEEILQAFRDLATIDLANNFVIREAESAADRKAIDLMRNTNFSFESYAELMDEVGNRDLGSESSETNPFIQHHPDYNSNVRITP